MFTSNDIIILTLTPFIIFFTRRAKISPLPYLVSEFIVANTFSMIFIIGNPTNIYIASNFNIDFMSYLSVMWLPTLLSGVVEFLILFLLFYKKLKEPIQYEEEQLSDMNMTLVIFALSILIICTILLVVSSYVRFLEMYYVSFASLLLIVIFALIYCFVKKYPLSSLGHTFKRAPYELIPFLLSMFVIALTLEHYGFTNQIHNFFGDKMTNITYGFSSLVSANLLNNIPMSVLYTSIIHGLEGNALSYAVYGSIIGSNLGAFITPLGALAGIMWMSILKKENIHYRFIDFVKYGLIVGIPVSAIAIFSLMITI